jgi:hypothetical protein
MGLVGEDGYIVTDRLKQIDEDSTIDTGWLRRPESILRCANDEDSHCGEPAGEAMRIMSLFYHSAATSVRLARENIFNDFCEQWFVNGWALWSFVLTAELLNIEPVIGESDPRLYFIEMVPKRISWTIQEVTNNSIRNFMRMNNADGANVTFPSMTPLLWIWGLHSSSILTSF